MKASKRKKLEADGWRVGSTSDFLSLTEEEEALVEIKLALARNLKERRMKRRLTQVRFAKLIGSSQSRVAKMEVADRSVSMDLLVRNLLLLGATRKEIGALIGRRSGKKKNGTPRKKKYVET